MDRASANTLPENDAVTESLSTVPQSLSDMSDAEDSFKEKYYNVVVLVKKLQTDVARYKIQEEGHRTLKLCRDEDAKELRRLRKHEAVSQKTIAVLQNRLIANKLPSTVELLDDDVIIPGPSRDVLDNLICENAKLQNALRLRQNTCDTEQLEKLLKENERLNAVVADLQVELKSVRESGGFLSSGLASDANLNNVKLLHQEIDMLKKDKKSQDVICASLAEEKSTLKQQLTEMANQCTQLVQRLEQKSPSAADHVHQENEQLRGQIKKITQTNLDWQRYQKVKEEEVQKLQDRLTRTEDQLARSAGSDVSTAQQERYDHLLEKCKSQIQVAEDAKLQTENENRKLRTQMHDLQQTCKNLQLRVTELHGQLQQADGVDVAALKLQVEATAQDFEEERRDREHAQARIGDLENDLAVAREQLREYQRGEFHRMRIRPTHCGERNNVAMASSAAVNHIYPRGVIQSDCPVPERHVVPNEDHERGHINLFERESSPPLLSQDLTPGLDFDEGPAPFTGAGEFHLPDARSRPLPVAVPESSRRDAAVGERSLLPPEEQSPKLLQFKQAQTEEFARSTQRRGPGEEAAGSRSKAEKSETLSCPACGKEFATERHYELLEHIDECCA